MAFLDNDGFVRVVSFQHASCRHDAVFSDGGASQNDHVAADPGVVTDFYRGCKEFFCFDTAGNPEVVVVVVDLRIRADLDAFSQDDFLHTNDTDTVSQGGIAADFQSAVSKNRQLGTPVGTNPFSQFQSAAVGDDDLRIGREPLDALILKMLSVKHLHCAKLEKCEKNADSIIQTSAQLRRPFPDFFYAKQA